MLCLFQSCGLFFFARSSGQCFSNALAQFGPGGLSGLSARGRLRVALNAIAATCFIRTDVPNAFCCNKNSTTAFASYRVRYRCLSALASLDCRSSLRWPRVERDTLKCAARAARVSGMPSGSASVNARLSLSIVSSPRVVGGREREAAQRVPVNGSADDAARTRCYFKTRQTDSAAEENKLSKLTKLAKQIEEKLSCTTRPVEASSLIQ